MRTLLYDLLKRGVSLCFNTLNVLLGGNLPPFGSAAVIVNDRSNYLIKDDRVAGGLRAFSWAEFARLHTIDPERYTIFGSTTSKYTQIADCVMPAVAEAVGHALNDYFEAIPSLYDPLPHLGYREVLSIDMKRESEEEDTEVPQRARSRVKASTGVRAQDSPRRKRSTSSCVSE